MHTHFGCLQLVVSPPVISTGTFITVLRMLSVMCANCPDLALTLLRQNIAETLCYLLTGSGDANMEEVLLSLSCYVVMLAQ
jgi:E3 ubiquitin-protein ligase TRIP12